jgi:hypothetical protein
MTNQTRQPFTNSASQSERAQVLENERRARRDTMHNRAMAEFSLEQAGRHAKQSTVIGTGAPNYPAGPNWSINPTGVEPPLGWDVNQIEPVGEPLEVAKSLNELGVGDADTQETWSCDGAHVQGDALSTEGDGEKTSRSASPSSRASPDNLAEGCALRSEPPSTPGVEPTSATKPKPMRRR